MLKTHIAACLVTTALLAGPALAQSNPPASTAPATPAPTVNAPAATAPATTAPSTVSSSSAMSGQYMTQMSTDQWRASKMVGLNIYGANNEKIGDVNEIVLDRSGNAQAVVIGVGGFLGIGEKNVAVPFKSVEWTYADRSTVAANAPAGTAPATTAPATTAAAPATTAPRTDVTGSTAATRNMDYPDHGILRMTKDELKNAPAFHYASDKK
ncbi:PRC-barrel domain-containing protein [Alsobacter sp. SYSU M60028]|uniref:PRC-barrel domain-containing protein n=1 Tax=Alsobacter ponti TaxID=2962936 RepID=A0ABT1LHH4_9HYPH|nr:PRC-barrel domain-containing protein [Alsobacter ponti]MCP8940951.1 PRC-barrel domain-containing protein [Alsobacter ponti]